MVKKLCLGIKLLEPEDEELGVVNAVEFSSEGFDFGSD